MAETPSTTISVPIFARFAGKEFEVGTIDIPVEFVGEDSDGDR